MTGKLKRSIIAWALLSPLLALTLFPFAVMLFSALKPRDEIFTSPPRWLPSAFRWANFVEMWQQENFGPALVNSLYASALSTALALLVAIPAAYALARYRFRGQGAFRQFLLTTQMLSPIVLVIGLFQMVAAFGLHNSLSALAGIYAAFNVAFAVWMLQSYFITIPRDLEEAAWLEGAGHFRTLVKVFLPLAAPAMAVTALFAFINSWNEFVLALTMLRSEGQHTLPIKVFSLVGGRYTIQWDHVMAATLLATLPVAVLFAWMQRYLVKGLALGAVK
jgi:multiple sugar transport system permease protein